MCPYQELTFTDDYLCGKKPSSELTHYIASSIEAAKGNKTWERDFMTFEEKMREEREEGERMFAELAKRLIETQRNDDLKAALDNADFRKDLYREFGIVED